MEHGGRRSAIDAGPIRPASSPRPWRDVRVLVVDGASGPLRVVSAAELPSLFEPRDLLILNDAATLPASIAARTNRGEALELRLAGAVSDRRWTVALLGPGSFRLRTEDRPAPPRLEPGDRLEIGGGLVATVVELDARSSRLADVELALEGRPDAPLAEIWAALYRVGRPVQYAHVPEALALWDVQNVYAGRPWAVEMPSAGRALRIETLLELRRRGVAIAWVTHAAGLSSIGDADIDAVLPLPERFDVSEETWEAVARARAAGGRVVAIGTSVVRALEGGARAGTRTGITDLRIGAGVRRAIVDAVLTGVHEADTSHHAMLGAFASPEVLARALERSADEGLLGHELGDAWLVWAPPRERSRVAPRSRPVASAADPPR